MTQALVPSVVDHKCIRIETSMLPPNNYTVSQLVTWLSDRDIVERVSNEQVVVDYANDIDTEKCAPPGGLCSVVFPVTSLELSASNSYLDQRVSHAT